MKKSIFLTFVFSFLAFGFLVFSAQAQNQFKTISLEGKLIKGESYETVYYLAEDGKRYVFPNPKTYFSWYEDFSQVETISDEVLFSYGLGGNVTYKPGALLVKITTDPKVYAVGENGKLRWVKSENVAKALYGANWNKLVDDAPDSFFTNYTIDENPIENEDDFDPIVTEKEYPTISHKLGFKAKEIIQKRVQSREERHCSMLESAVNKLQARAEMYGIEVPSIGDDFISQCVENSQVRNSNKVQVCQMMPNGKYRNSEVAMPAVKGVLNKRGFLGECPERVVVEDEEEGDNEEAEERCKDGDDSSEACLALEAAKAAVASTSAAFLVAEELASSTAAALVTAEELASSTALALEEANATTTPENELAELVTAAEEAEAALVLARDTAEKAEEALAAAKVAKEAAEAVLAELEG